MTISIVTLCRNARMDQITTFVDADVGAGNLVLRTGAGPASANDAATGTVLVTIPLNDPFAAAAALAILSLSGLPLSAVATATGDAGHFRITDNSGDTVLQGSVTASGGGGDLIIDTVTVNSGQTVTLNVGSQLTEGNP